MRSGSSRQWQAGHHSISGAPVAHGGSSVARFSSFQTSRGDRARLERTGDVGVASRHESVALTDRMYHTTYSHTRNDSVRPAVTADGRSWDAVGSLAYRWDGSTRWTLEGADLTACKGAASLQVGFEGISAGGQSDSIDDVRVVAQLPASTTFRLSGMVTRDGSPAAVVTVAAGTASTVTAADGSSTLDVVDGTYAVSPSKDGSWFSFESRSVTTSCADQAGLDLEPREGYPVDVTVTADELDAARGGTDADTGLSLREAVVEANRSPGQTAWTNLQARTYGLTRAGRDEDASLTGDLDVAPFTLIQSASHGLGTGPPPSTSPTGTPTTRRGRATSTPPPSPWPTRTEGPRRRPPPSSSPASRPSRTPARTTPTRTRSSTCRPPVSWPTTPTSEATRSTWPSPSPTPSATTGRR